MNCEGGMIGIVLCDESLGFKCFRCEQIWLCGKSKQLVQTREKFMWFVGCVEVRGVEVNRWRFVGRDESTRSLWGTTEEVCANKHFVGNQNSSPLTVPDDLGL